MAFLRPVTADVRWLAWQDQFEGRIDVWGYSNLAGAFPLDGPLFESLKLAENGNS